MKALIRNLVMIYGVWLASLWMQALINWPVDALTEGHIYHGTLGTMLMHLTVALPAIVAALFAGFLASYAIDPVWPWAWAAAMTVLVAVPIATGSHWTRNATTADCLMMVSTEWLLPAVAVLAGFALHRKLSARRK